VERAGVCRLRVEEATLGEPQRYRRGLRDVSGDTWGGGGEKLIVVEGKLLGTVEKVGVVGAFPKIPEGGSR